MCGGFIQFYRELYKQNMSLLNECESDINRSEKLACEFSKKKNRNEQNSLANKNERIQKKWIQWMAEKKAPIHC